MKYSARQVFCCASVRGRLFSPIFFGGAMGAPPVAGSSDLSEWQRSADDAATPLARNMPSTATGDVSEADWGSYLIFTALPPTSLTLAHLPHQREVFHGRRQENRLLVPVPPSSSKGPCVAMLEIMG